MKKFMIIFLLGFLGYAQEVKIPSPVNYVSDYANVIDETTESELNSLLEELANKTGSEIAILTVKTTQPLDDFSYGIRVFEEWGIGGEAEDKGLLFLVAVEDKRSRIITGYGLEGILPDGKVGEVLDQVIPFFREGNYSQGIYNGTWALAEIIAKDAGVELVGLPPSPSSPPSERGGNLISRIILVILLVFLLNALLFRRRSLFGFPFLWIPWGFGGFGGMRSGFGGFSSGSFGGFGGGATGGGGAGRGW
jgi:uncharacterized protein